jgi:hypothetical protein
MSDVVNISTLDFTLSFDVEGAETYLEGYRDALVDSAENFDDVEVDADRLAHRLMGFCEVAGPHEPPPGLNNEDGGHE